MRGFYDACNVVPLMWGSGPCDIFFEPSDIFRGEFAGKCQDWGL